MTHPALRTLRDKIQKFRQSREPGSAMRCPVCDGTNGERIERKDGNNACDKCSVICRGCFCYCDPDCVNDQSVCRECESEPTDKVTRYAAGEDVNEKPKDERTERFSKTKRNP